MIFEGRASIGVAMLVFGIVFLWKVYAARHGKLPEIRRLPALDAIDEAVGRATELGKPIHQTLGSGSITSSAASPMILAGISVSRYVARKAAEMDTSLIVTVAAAETYSVAEEVVRTAYIEAGKPDAYDPSVVRFLSPAQFAYTTAAIGIMTREQVAANIMIGYFAAESLILAETGNSLGAIQIAGTAVMPQIPFFVVACDYCLIGEEVYAVSAYLDREPETLGTIAGQDVAKAMAAVLIVIGSIAVTLGSTFLVDLLAK